MVRLMSDITQILSQIEDGDPGAAEWLLPVVSKNSSPLLVDARQQFVIGQRAVVSSD